MAVGGSICSLAVPPNLNLPPLMDTITSYPVTTPEQTLPLNLEALRPRRAPWYALLLWLAVFASGYFRVGQSMLAQCSLYSASPLELNVIRATAAQVSIEPAEAGYYAWCPHRTAADIQPLYPWLVAQGAASQGSLEPMPQLYQRGVWLNFWLGLGFVSMLGLWLWKQAGLVIASTGMMLLGFGVLLPHGMFYEPTLLWLGLYGVCFAFILQILKRNSVWSHVGLGLTAGLAYLTDLSILPLVASWALMTVLRVAWQLARNQACESGNAPGPFIGLLGFGLAASAVIGPNLQFHHLNGHTWAPVTAEYLQVEEATETGSQRVDLHTYLNRTPDRPAQVLHQALEKLRAMVFPGRLADTSPEGAARILPWRGTYAWGLLALLIIAALHARSRGPAWFQDSPAADRHAGARVGFVFLNLAIGLLAAGLYHGHDGADSTMLHLYSTVVIALLLGAGALREWAERRGGGGRIYSLVFHVWQALLCVGLIVSVVAFYRITG